MKITAVLLFCCFVNIFAAPTYSQATKISLTLQAVTIEEALNKIEDMSEFYFLFNNKLINVTRKVDVRADKEPIRDVLTEIFGNDVKFTVVDRQIILTPGDGNELSIAMQQLRVAGIVTDEKGNPLVGVTVLVKGTTIGALTDMSGQYTILNAPRNAILIFSFIGMTTQEIALNERDKIDVVLQEAAVGLDEVVVTALGIKREKKALTYAVSEVAGESITKARELNLGNALSGMVAGVTVSSTTGGPAASTRVIVRGNGSLNGDNQPLYVVNGMPITNTNLRSAGTYGGIDRGDGLSSINPDDIESISVLKGGTAAALYGSRASNGVILIKTKSGRAQKGIGVQYNTTYTMEKPVNLLDWQYEYGSGSNGFAPTSQGQAVSFGRTSWGANLDGSIVIQPDGELRPYSAQKENVKNFYQTGSTFSNTIALIGGTEAANLRFSASNVDNKGIVPNNSLNRKTFNLSANATLAKKVVFEGNAQYSIEDVKNRTYVADFPANPNAGTQLIATNIDVRTLSPGYLEDGTEMSWCDYIYSTNPYFVINKIKNGDTRNRFIGSFATKYNITDFLYARIRFGMDQINIDGYNITPSGQAGSVTGGMSTDQSYSAETNIEASIGLNKEIGFFSVNVFAGGNQMRNTFDGISLSSGNLKIPNIYFIGNGASQSFSESFRKVGINSLFASADIDFKNYLYLTLSGRNDWFSTLDSGGNNIFYPSVGLSYLVSEAWKAKPVWMNYAKIRTSWAQVGGGSPSPYAIQRTYSAQANPHLGQPLMNVTSSTIPSLLTPYTSTTYEAGIEMRLFNSRLGIDLTVYDKITSDDIVNAAIAPSSAYNSVALNIGKMKNEGIELMLSGTPVKLSNGFSWDMSLNIAYNKNEVIKIADGLTSLQLPNGTTRTLNGWIYHFEGQPFGIIAGYRQLKDANGNLVFNSTSGLPVASTLLPLGRGVPPMAVSINNNINFKGFSFSFLFDSRWGGSIYSATNAYGTDFGLHKRTVENNIRETGITFSGVDQNGAPFTETITAEKYYRGTAYTITDYFVEKADFIKLRSFSFGYNLPSSILKKTPFQSANLSLVGRNLLLLYNAAENIDPESNYSNSNAQGLENFGLPTTRSYGFNLSVVF